MSDQIRVSTETLQSRAREYGKAANDIRQLDKTAEAMKQNDQALSKNFGIQNS